MRSLVGGRIATAALLRLRGCTTLALLRFSWANMAGAATEPEMRSLRC